MTTRRVRDTLHASGCLFWAYCMYQVLRIFVYFPPMTTNNIALHTHSSVARRSLLIFEKHTGRISNLLRLYEKGYKLKSPITSLEIQHSISSSFYGLFNLRFESILKTLPGTLPSIRSPYSSNLVAACCGGHILPSFNCTLSFHSSSLGPRSHDLSFDKFDRVMNSTAWLKSMPRRLAFLSLPTFTPTVAGHVDKSLQFSSSSPKKLGKIMLFLSKLILRQFPTWQEGLASAPFLRLSFSITG
jgi:hypothetical protein